MRLPVSETAAVVILAAGEGTRMKSRTPKVLHTLAGRSLLGHAIAACVVAAVASAFTGRAKGGAGAAEPLGAELAGVAGEGTFEPAELVIPNVAEDTPEKADKPGISS